MKKLLFLDLGPDYSDGVSVCVDKPREDPIFWSWGTH